jgi:hypothetical protein
MLLYSAPQNAVGRQKRRRMAKDGAFNATKAAFAMYGGLLRDVAQEIGIEKAIALHARRGEAFGAELAEMTKKALGKKKLNMKTFVSFETQAGEVFGMNGQIREEKKNSCKVIWARCAIYEGLSSAGLDHQTIESLCSKMSGVEYAELTKAFPQFSGCVKFRSAPDQPCVEEFALVKVGKPA